MPPVAWVGFVAAGTVGAATVFGVVTAAGVGDDETVLDDVELGRDEVAEALEAGPPPDSSTTAASTAVSYTTVLFMIFIPCRYPAHCRTPR